MVRHILTSEYGNDCKVLTNLTAVYGIGEYNESCIVYKSVTYVGWMGNKTETTIKEFDNAKKTNEYLREETENKDVRIEELTE